MNIYVIRHCEAVGQSAESPLTKKGFEQAEKLADFLSGKQIEKVYSSPYLRAVQSIKPFARTNELDVELDDRLAERVLGSKHFPDWQDKLRSTFNDLDLKYEGGESSNEAADRILMLVNEMIASEYGNAAIVAHGGIISLLLHHYDNDFAFEQWKSLRNPDVFVLRISEKNIRFDRIY